MRGESSLPVVAIVGAPNVGKSTLFNRILGRRKAIVSDRPGVTRDRIAAECDLFGSKVVLVDTGGVVSGQADDLARRVRGEALKAVREADLILFVVDARAGLTATDHEVVSILRRSGKPVLTLANKIDATSLEGLELDLHRIGLGEIHAISAEQGRGLDEVIEQILKTLPAPLSHEGAAGVPIAIIGRPNVGKSSLFNRIVREDRALVSATPGTTRDPVDATFLRSGVLYRIVDTAGIRRRARGSGDIEWVSVLKAKQAAEEAEIVVAMVDGSDEIGHQDLALLGLVTGQGIPAVLAVNKVDRLPARPGALSGRLRAIRNALRFSQHVPVVGISATTGAGVERLLRTIDRLREETHRRFPTAVLNRALQALVRERQPPSDRGRDVRFYYMTQVGEAPPRFVVFGNGRRVGAPYRRFMEARLRDLLGVAASPLTFTFRRSRNAR